MFLNMILKVLFTGVLKNSCTIELFEVFIFINRTCLTKLYFKGFHDGPKYASGNLVPSVYSRFKKRLQHRCFPVNHLKSLRTPILKNICERLLLKQLFFGYWFLKMCYLREYSEGIEKALMWCYKISLIKT